MDVRRVLGIVGGSALWIAVIIVGAGPGPVDDVWVGTTNLDAIVVTVGAAVALVALLVILLSDGSGPAPERSGESPWSALATLAAVALVLVIWQPQAPELAPTESETVGADVDLGFDEEADVSEELPVATVELRDLLLVAALGALAIAAIQIVRGRAKNAQTLSTAVDSEASEYADALRAARSQLDLPVDARAAVLAAYAELERVLHGLGRGRRPAETVQEHQLAVLDTFDLDDGPVRVLGGLYSRARFSDAVITTDDREAARRALDTALGHLPTP